ncbi:uncharacterized protein LOC117221918 [Megalopta genalis]|uniref:uncharacterized protein LOC117221918 n=1 Tax=Megalopta genalis TaxID=115081 RepID=UPI001442F72F|nr:uncharacterized protein LOC117221918 [Megalopta genalis]
MRYSGSNLLGYAVSAFILFFTVTRAESGVPCKDHQGRSYETGGSYILGSNPCTLCICDNGNPKLCKAFVCTKFPEEDCKSFLRSDICCQYICLDDRLSSILNYKTDGIGNNATDTTPNYDIGLRSVASFVTAVLSLSLLFFLIHRLRQRKIRVCVAGRQNRQLAEDQRNLGSMGYLERDRLSYGVPMDDIPCGANYPLWKPPSNYFPRGEAPPPYEEAVAAARAEQALLSMNPQALPQLNFPNSYLTNATSRTNISLVGSTQSGINGTLGNPTNLICDSSIADSSGLASTPNRPISNPNIYTSYRQSNQNEPSQGVSVGTSTTNFTMGTNTYENLPASIGISNFVNQHADVAAQQPPVSSNLQTSVSKNYQTHTTLPRQTGAFTISATLSNSNISAHRTIPRTLTTARTATRLQGIMNDYSTSELLRPSPTNASSNLPLIAQKDSLTDQENRNTTTFYHQDAQTQPSSTPSSSRQQHAESRHHQSDHRSEESHNYKPPLNVANEINEEGSFESVACVCSMQALPTLHDDTDDYRSECENCKSATGSRYYLDNENELITSPHETMTLHRRPDETASSTTPQYYRTSLTLPISTRQRARSTGVRENWFNTMPQSSTESSDEN